jgi:hypothetical protein
MTNYRILETQKAHHFSPIDILALFLHESSTLIQLSVLCGFMERFAFGFWWHCEHVALNVRPPEFYKIGVSTPIYDVNGKKIAQFFPPLTRAEIIDGLQLGAGRIERDGTALAGPAALPATRSSPLVRLLWLLTSFFSSFLLIFSMFSHMFFLWFASVAVFGYGFRLWFRLWFRHFALRLSSSWR